MSKICVVNIRLLIQRAALSGIQGYRYLLSPLLPPSCRFTPTCSCYAMEAIQLHGTLRGILLSCYRILRCHPFCRGGYDPVPPVSRGNCGDQCACEKSQATNNKTCETFPDVIS